MQSTHFKNLFGLYKKAANFSDEVCSIKAAIRIINDQIVELKTIGGNKIKIHSFVVNDPNLGLNEFEFQFILSPDLAERQISNIMAISKSLHNHLEYLNELVSYSEERSISVKLSTFTVGHGDMTIFVCDFN